MHWTDRTTWYVKCSERVNIFISSNPATDVAKLNVLSRVQRTQDYTAWSVLNRGRPATRCAYLCSSITQHEQHTIQHECQLTGSTMTRRTCAQPRKVRGIIKVYGSEQIKVIWTRLRKGSFIWVCENGWAAWTRAEVRTKRCWLVEGR